MFTKPKLISMAACNRCADFYDAVRACGEKISRAAFRLSPGFKKLTPDEMEQLRDILKRLTRQYAELTCSHFFMETVWQPDFVEQIIDHPGKSGVILKAYRNSIADLRKAAV